MSQHDFDIANQTASAARADINSALQALASSNSGATAPSTTYANMLWYETDTNILKMRNEANSAWINLFYIDQTNSEVKVLEGTDVSLTDGTSTGVLAPHADSTWNTGTNPEPRLVSPAQLKATIESLGLYVGVNQTWQSPSRGANITYQNTTGRPIQVSVQLGQNAGYQFQVSTDGSNWTVMYKGDGGAPIQGACIIPHAYYYRATGGITYWRELR